MGALASIATVVGAGATIQTPQPFRILLTNDDGVRAPGVLAVALALRGQAELTIAAPTENQSGKGHSITTSDPIFVDTITLAPDLPAYSLQTTPASCVKVAVGALMTQKPDMVVSGINRGYNLGTVTYVSGTVGAAREAALMGIPAIAASLAVPDRGRAVSSQPRTGDARRRLEAAAEPRSQPGRALRD